jgi:hypothetical protein
MIIVVAIVALFVLISIFLYFRVENLQRDIMLAKKESHQARKEHQKIIEALVAVANKYQEFAIFRHKQLLLRAESTEQTENIAELQLISPLVNNYSHIFRECLSANKLQVVVKASYERANHGSFQEFESLIKQQDAALRKMWMSNNVTGYAALVEALLIKQTNLLAQIIPSLGKKTA